MSIVLFITFLAIPRAFAQIQGELNCTVYNGTTFVYSPAAVACENVLSDEFCSVAYPPVYNYFEYPSANHNQPRPLLCFTTATAQPALINRDAKTAAIAHCAKTCGLCCQTPAYSCKNAQFPRLNCATVTRNQCTSPAWRQILSEDCPNVCGFCDLNGCIDLVSGCDNDVTICNAVGMQEFVNVNCRRTCGRCSTATPAPCGGR